MFKYIVLIFLGAVTSLFLLYYITTSEDITDVQWYYWMIIALSGSMVLILLEYVSVLLDKFIPWRSNSGYRMLAGIVVVNLVVLILGALVLKLGAGFVTDETDLLVAFKPLLTKLIILSSIFSLIYSIIYFARASYKQFATLQVETIRQERKQIDLQLKALKSQLSPHFLFNSLNSVSSLIHKNEKGAEAFVRRLALMYQYILDSYEKKLVPLHDELKFASAYHHLLHIRFGENLILNNKVGDNILTTKIPPVTIQMLIENAIKHNVIKDDQSLNIEIKADENYLIIENNLTQKNEHAKSHKIGLKNIKARYKLLTGKQIVVKSEESFIVKLPLIP